MMPRWRWLVSRRRINQWFARHIKPAGARFIVNYAQSDGTYASPTHSSLSAREAAVALLTAPWGLRP